MAAKTKLLRIGSTLNIKQINLLTDYYYNILAMLMTHDSLVRFDPDLRVVPQLAQSWECLEGGKLWKFRLVPDARWHDGYPVSATDIKFTFKYLALHNPSAGWIADLIEDVQANDREVVFRLKKPNSRFLINAGFIVRILPEHIWGEIDSPQKTNNS
ncbi:MAG: ABC transporter substrate-binding protein, partial [Thermodesulfobacteriota bacterium]|nr:ABC transporter substrate-binding protein [Thermodesulfobacteriota bacterium]